MPDNRLSANELLTRQKQRSGVVLNAKKELAKGDDALNDEAINVRTIQVIAAKLRDYQKRIQDFNCEIQDALSDDGLDEDIDRMNKLDDDITEMLANLEVTVELHKEEKRNAQGSLNHSRSDVRETSHLSATGSSRVRLPKIELMTYNGDPLKWDEFWDYYDITFHSNADIPVIEKFTYLRSLLTGDALRLAEGYRLTDANYDEVINALKERFGDPEIAIFQHFDAMLTLPVAAGDVNDLQRVFDVCEAHIRSLIALGLGEDTFGRVFAPILLSKLPGRVRVELIRKKGRNAWTLSKLRELLRDEIYAQDMSKRSFGASKTSESRQNNGPHQNKSFKFQQKGQFTASALPSSEKKGPNKKQLTCIFCEGPHYNNRCTAFASADARRQKIRGSCYCCLGSRHTAKDCEKKKPCYYCKSTDHHQTLCRKKFPSQQLHDKVAPATQLNVGSSKADSVVQKSVTSSVMSHDGQRGVLQTAVANVSGDKCSISARHMMDNGSDNSFISNGLANKIGARCVGVEKISLAGFSDSKRKQQTYKVYEFKISLKNGTQMSIKAYGTNVIICSIDKLAFDTKQYPILTRVPLAEPLAKQNEHVKVDILIGSDYYYDIVKSERIPLCDGLVLLDSELGYIVAGRVKSSSDSAASMLITRSPMPESNFDIERFWKLEDIGVNDPPDTNEDELALQKFNQSVQFDETEKRYLVKWPFKRECEDLPNNFGLAFGRLKSMVARTKIDSSVFHKYEDVLNDQVQKEIIEEAPDVPDGPVHYLPHHAVVRPDKATTKVRIVYDASSKTNRQVPSLNDCVHRGPVMLENLSGLILRFRLRQIAIVSDIEKAFLQVGLQKEDRDVTRFLWIRDPTKPCTADNIIHYRFRRVCFGVIASPFLLAATLTYHLKRIGTPVAERMLSNLYVDNIIDGDDTVESARAYYTEAKKIFQSASMNLREWYSNSSEFMSTITAEDRGKGTTTKVLGLTWDLAADTISCSPGTLNSDEIVTKRIVLHNIAKIFDPCGYCTPVTSAAKLLMQEIWQRKYDWDSPLDNEIVKSWNEILSNLRRLKDCKIERFCCSVDGAETIQIHAFCDASAKAYCAAIYLVMANGSTAVSNLIFSKSRVSPLQQHSIPRLELIAATVGMRLIRFVSTELRLPISKTFLWSDSQCVLHWILGKPVSTVFVRNRVQEIKKTPYVEFRYVPTADNPADIPTRGMPFDEFRNSKLWWHGPEWLTKANSWPDNIIPAKDVDANTETPTEDDSGTVLTSIAKEEHEYLMDLEKVSSLSKLLRVTAWVQRFVRNCRKKSVRRFQMTLRSDHSSMNESRNAMSLTAEELRSAKLIWELAVQKRHFGRNFESANEKRDFLKSLGQIFTNEHGLLCCRSRLGNSDVPEDAMAPKLLPKNDRYVDLLIDDYHKRFKHAGVKQTLAELRCEYWILHGRSVVKRVIYYCLLCRRQRGGSFATPSIPDLPQFRVQQSPPFSTVGIDYLGPLMTYAADGYKQKVWICLFTCAVTRALHLEVVGQLDTASFLLCLRRFVSFWGRPKMIVSDNAGQFTLSQRVLDKLWQETCNSHAVQEFSASQEISWKFITESAPWMGGFYERLVGIVKSCLRAAIDRRKLNMTELQTVTYEVAAIVNSRPLVYSEEQSGDIALTPAHLAMRHRTIQPFLSVGEPVDHPKSTHDKLLSGWKRLQGLLDQFWHNWQKQYLLSLRERSRQDRQRKVIRSTPCAGQVVLIEDKTLPRCQWRVAKILEPVVSADNQVRSAKLRILNGNVLTRPIKQLYPLEIPKENWDRTSKDKQN